jgi:hypothetical protein
MYTLELRVERATHLDTPEQQAEYDSLVDTAGNVQHSAPPPSVADLRGEPDSTIRVVTSPCVRSHAIRRTRPAQARARRQGPGKVARVSRQTLTSLTSRCTTLNHEAPNPVSTFLILCVWTDIAFAAR